MKKLNILIAIIFSWGIALEGFAQAKPLVADCAYGSGCTFTISDYTYEQFDYEEGTSGIFSNMTHDAMIVYTNIKGRYQRPYIESNMTRSELDIRYGGDGFTQIYVFDPRIQPLDGQWKATVGNTSASACMVDVAGMVKRSLQGFAKGGHILFEHPFTIRKLLNSPVAKWKMINPAQYRAIIDFGGGIASPMKMTYDVTLKSSTRIEGVFSFVITVPTKEPCTATIPVTYVCEKIDGGQLGPDTDIDPFEEKKKFDVDRLPDDRPKANVDRLPDDPIKRKNKKVSPDDLLPAGNPPTELKDMNSKPYVERLRDKMPTGNIDRLPDDRPKANVDRLPDDPPKKKGNPPAADDLLPAGNEPTGLKSTKKQPYIERLPDEIPQGKVDRLPDDHKVYIKLLE